MAIKRMLFSDAEANALKVRTASWRELKTIYEDELSFEPDPPTVFEAESSYTEEGSEENLQSLRISRAGQVAYRSALLYRITKDESYAERSQEIIDVFVDNLSIIKGDVAKGIIGFHFLYFVLAGDWVRGVNGWGGNAFSDFLMDVIKPASRRDYKNNIASWWCALEAGIYAYRLNNPTVLASDRKGMSDTRILWRTQIANQVCRKISSIAPVKYSPACSLSFVKDLHFSEKEWTLPDEITRSTTSDFHGGETKGRKGISYTHFGMLPWALSAEILYKKGYDCYKTTEARYFENIFTKVVGWVDNPSTFPYADGQVNQLLNVRQCSYFALLWQRLKSADKKNREARVKAKDLLQISGDILGDHYQLDLLFMQKWNPPTGL